MWMLSQGQGWAHSAATQEGSVLPKRQKKKKAFPGHAAEV